MKLGALVFPENKKEMNLPAVQETWVQFLGQEDPLEEDMATYSSILAWRIPWTEEAVGLQSMGSQRIRHDSAAKQKYKKNVRHKAVFACFHL